MTDASRESVATMLLDLVLPRHCVGCGSSGAALCRDCTAAGPVLRPTAVDGMPVAAAVPYDGAVRAALIAYKERGRRELAAALAALLTRAVASVLGDAAGDGRQGLAPGTRVVLVAAPSSSAAVRVRGGDHLAALTRRAARTTGLRVAPSVLRIARSVQDSAGLGVAQRAANLDHAFTACRPPRATAALVVDDIVTTGATLREAVRALRAAGWPVAGAAVVAATPRTSPTRRTGASPSPHWQGTVSGSSVSTT